MSYAVKEIFYTLQGEGANAGRAAVFCRFAGCNLWTGREQDRAHAVCQFCDTDFVGIGPDGGRFATAHDLAAAVDSRWPSRPPAGLDWICVSPKAGAPLRVTAGHELKLVYPQREPEAQPERFEGLAFRQFWLQPMDVADPAVREANVRAAIAYCLAHPRWRLSVQTHKVVGVR